MKEFPKDVEYYKNTKVFTERKPFLMHLQIHISPKKEPGKAYSY